MRTLLLRVLDDTSFSLAGLALYEYSLPRESSSLPLTAYSIYDDVSASHDCAHVTRIGCSSRFRIL